MESRLKKVLEKGHFALTGELGPPRGADVNVVIKKANYLKGVVDAVNITDNPTGVVRMASWAASYLCLQQGVEPVFQIVCRDRNRLAIQSNVLGAYALGIRNILCLSGDHIKFGDHPQAKAVFDIDSTQLIMTLKKLRDEEKFLSDAPVKSPPKNLFIGCATNPFTNPLELTILRFKKKIRAGAQFVQTQAIFNMKRAREWIKILNEEGITEKVYILAGVIPLKSYRMAMYMKEKVPGMDIPDELIKRINLPNKKDQEKEGLKITYEIIEELRSFKGISGIHLMAVGWEHRVKEIAEEAKLLPRPQV